MKILLKVIRESILQALGQLRGNKLRSFLSLLGISIGIFCIIGVLSAVDSLEDNVRSSMAKLGNDVIYVKKWPWRDVSGEWWDYIKRPHPSYEDYELLNDRAKLAQLTAYHVVLGFKTVKYKSSSVDRAVLIAASQEFDNMFKLEFETGRYFSPAEYNYGSNKIIMGFKVAEELFGGLEATGKRVKLMGKEFEVIGVIEQAGDDLINPLDFDDCILVSYNSGRSLANLKATNVWDATVTIKAEDGVNLVDVKDESRGLLRAHRRLKPIEDDDFSLNELSMISSVFDSFFGVLNLLGIVIGLFAILVGVVSVANIMFVSVKERTGIIGVKKALGAKRYIILLEFLIESIILCIIGGLIGLTFVYIITKILTQIIDFELYVDTGNIMLGLFISVMIGVVSGFIPALRASNMDPVVAMRQ
ncbi:ABC transporter permease [Flavilitoribacter nigricans]|uniref:Peptide ABC transporter permease n=1 Tax=Flavilitoribacter nigricans (strain ATCC 23147 / DSM 23189 / NBRC 102662 / NCIMB 1420 / SS-2) TaxID=1122177 RepID=A0A2D0NG67_FLAN2|nr:ABC transporter permease [Flavilitoribacter nigricans]PHN07467.1 peptide ABC transporter permease [Flavilitoribacter nigricans DSM 23189 = NBRC 102662]